MAVKSDGKVDEEHKIKGNKRSTFRRQTIRDSGCNRKLYKQLCSH